MSAAEKQPAPFAPLDLDEEDDFGASLAGFTPRAASPPLPVAALEKISEAAGFPPRSRATPGAPPPPAEAAPKGRDQVVGRRKRQLTGRNYTFSVRLRPADAQRIYDLVEEMGAETVADVVEAALDALDEKRHAAARRGR